MKTIRFYCDQCLISPSNRTQAGYRLLGHSSYRELSSIRSPSAINIPLSELRSGLEVRRSGACNFVVLKTAIQSNPAGIWHRVKGLYQMRLELAKLMEQWQDCGGAKPAAMP